MISGIPCALTLKKIGDITEPYVGLFLGAFCVRARISLFPLWLSVLQAGTRVVVHLNSAVQVLRVDITACAIVERVHSLL